MEIGVEACYGSALDGETGMAKQILAEGARGENGSEPCDV